MESKPKKSFSFDQESSSSFHFVSEAQRDDISSQTTLDSEDLKQLSLDDPRFPQIMKAVVEEKARRLEESLQGEDYNWHRAYEMPLDECESELFTSENGICRIPPPLTPRQLVNKRARYWMGTHNDWSPFHLIRIKGRLKPFHINYCVIFKEVAPTTGHIHAHSLFAFTSPVQFNTLAKIDPGAHWDTQSNGPAEIYKYISKDGNKVFEYGSPPASVQNLLNKVNKTPTVKVTAFDQAMNMLKEGKIEELQETRTYAQYQRFFDQKITRTLPCKRWQGELKQKNHWVYGPPGSGKSKAVWDAAENKGLTIFMKQQNKWWDGYHGEDIVLIEDADPEWMKRAASNLKVWSDRYPFNAEVKGTILNVPCPSFYLVITSNYSMEECFNPTDLGALRRRFEEHFMDIQSDI